MRCSKSLLLAMEHRSAAGGAAAGAAGGAAGATGSAAADAAGGAARQRPYFVQLLQQVLGSPPSPPPTPPPPFLSPPPVQSQSQLPPDSPLPGPSPYSGPTRGLTEHREPESRPVSPASRPASPVRTVRAGRVSRSRLPPVPGTYSMTMRPSTAPQRVSLPSPPVSSLPDGPDPESDSLRAASPTVTRFLATAVTNPLFKSSAAFALVAELVDFAAACRLDYAASLVAESVSASVCPPSVGGECALGTDVLEDRQEDLECFAAASPHLVSMLLAPEGDPDALDIPTPRSYAEAIEGPYSSQWQAAMDVEMASLKSTGTYVDEVPPPGANIVSGMWIFRVKRPPGSPPAFKARYVARGFSQRQGVDFFQTFSPTPKMTTLQVLLHVAAQRDYELHSLDFSIAFLQGSLHEEIWLRRPPGFTGSFATRRCTSSWTSHHTSGMGLVLGGRARVVLTGHADASWVDDLATQRSSQGCTFSLGSGSVSWRSTRSSSVLSSSSFCRAQGIRHTFTLPASPQQNGIAERRIGMVMDVARTSMIHAAAPHFLWPFAVQYAAHQLNLQPRVSVPETSPTLRWTGKVGDASAFRVWGSRAFVRDLSGDKLSPRAVPCVFLGFPPDAPGWQFYHPTSRRVLSSHDVTFDESVPFYRLFPYRTAPLPPPLLFLAPGPPPVDPLTPQGPAPSGVSQVDAVEPVEVAIDSGAARGAELAGAGSGGAESRGAEPGGAESGGAEREPLSPQELREWFARRWSRAAGAGGSPVAPGPGGARTGGTRAAGAGGAAATTGVGPAGASGATSAGAAGGVGAGVGAAGASGAAGAGAAGGVGAGVCPSGGPVRPRPYFVPLLEQVLGLLPSPGPAPPLDCPHPVPSQSPLQPVSPLPAPSPYAGPTRGLAERLPGTHQMTLRPSTAPLRVPLPSPPESSLPVLADPAFDSLRAASPTAARLLSTVVTNPSFESTAASALVAELVDFAACCRLDFAASLVAESASVCPLSVGGECALSTDVLEDRQEEFQCFAAALPHLVSMLIAPEGDPDAPDIPTPRSYAEAIEGPYSSQWQSAMDAEMASWKSTGTYVDDVPPPWANIVSGMWIFRVKRPPGSPPVFKARYVARGFSQRQGVDYFQTFSPTPKMTTLRVLLHVAAQRDYELHSLDFSIAFLQGSLHEEIWLRRPPGFTGLFPPGTQWSLRRPVYGLRQAPRQRDSSLHVFLGFSPVEAPAPLPDFHQLRDSD
ncbi:unnamed protein product [Closterium sp. NIES-54]